MTSLPCDESRIIGSAHPSLSIFHLSSVCFVPLAATPSKYPLSAMLYSGHGDITTYKTAQPRLAPPPPNWLRFFESAWPTHSASHRSGPFCKPIPSAPIKSHPSTHFTCFQRVIMCYTSRL